MISSRHSGEPRIGVRGRRRNPGLCILRSMESLDPGFRRGDEFGGPRGLNFMAGLPPHHALYRQGRGFLIPSASMGGRKRGRAMLKQVSMRLV